MKKWLGRLKWKLLPVVEFAFRAVGGNWNDFYSWMLDRQERNNSIEDIKSRYNRDLSSTKKWVKGLYDISTGPLFVEFLEEEGIKPDHDFLDFGCGYGRVGVPLMRYLDEGKYVGVDLSAERVRMAKEYVESEGLTSRKPEFHVAQKDNSVAFLEDRKFDCIWLFSVFSHMPFADVEAVLRELKPHLKPDGVLIANYGFSDRIHKTNISAFWVSVEDMQEMVSRLGYKYDQIEEWEKRISPDRTFEKMMKLTVA